MADRTQGVLVVVTGPPASGKTTFATEVATELGIAVLSKDSFKETLYDLVGSDDERESLVEEASVRLVLALARDQLEAQMTVIVESNFDDEQVEAVRALLDEAGAGGLQLYCDLSEDEVVERFRERAASGDRHPGHGDRPEDAEEVRGQLRSGVWDPLELGVPLERLRADDDESVGRAVRAVRKAAGAT